MYIPVSFRKFITCLKIYAFIHANSKFESRTIDKQKEKNR